jgi:hypothetical protein
VLSWMAVRVSSMDGGATMLRGTEQGGAQQPTLVEGAPTPLLHSNVGVQRRGRGCVRGPLWRWACGHRATTAEAGGRSRTRVASSGGA